jgi:hypothetical protein
VTEWSPVKRGIKSRRLFFWLAHRPCRVPGRAPLCSQFLTQLMQGPVSPKALRILPTSWTAAATESGAVLSRRGQQGLLGKEVPKTRSSPTLCPVTPPCLARLSQPWGETKALARPAGARHKVNEGGGAAGPSLPPFGGWREGFPFSPLTLPFPALAGPAGLALRLPTPADGHRSS